MVNKHTKIVSEMIATYKVNAKKLLEANADFSEVCYLSTEDEKLGTYDSNQTNRYRILVGIQFTEDIIPYENLIRYLLLEEIKDRETNSFQGYGNELNLAVWLIKTFCKESDLELFERAKKANFDTYCGFDAEDIHINYFESDVTTLDIDDCLELALDLQENNYSHKLLKLWKSNQTSWNEDNLNQLRWYEHRRKNTVGELDTLIKLFELKGKNAYDWDYCSLSEKIANKQIELRQIPAAFSTIIQMLPRLMNINEWQRVGLGQFIMEDCMDIVILGDEQIAEQIWYAMKPHAIAMENMYWMHWNLYKKSAKAADKMGDSELSQIFLERLNKEQKGLLKPGQTKKQTF